MSERSPDRIYELLPGHIRARDYHEGRPLQALLRILAAELDVVEDDLDLLYENAFIETCEDWAVPYIGDLVGARPLRPFGEGGGALRAYTANTLSYRQAKGTAAVLEQLARDVTGWPARAVEFFRLLIQTQNVNHVRPGNRGTADLREPVTAAGDPFEDFAHLLEVRSVADGEGRYNIPHLGLFLWRLQSVYLPFVYLGEDGYRGGVQPLVVDPGRLYLDPLGRDLPLFNRPRSETAMAQLAGPRHLPVRLRRRPLYRDLEALRAGNPEGGDWFRNPPVLRLRLNGAELPPQRLHCCNLEDRDDGQGGVAWRRPAIAGEVMFDPELGRLSLHPDDEGVELEATWAYGAAHDLGGGPYDRRASVEGWLDPFLAGGTPWQIGVSGRADEVTDNPDQGGPVVAGLAEAVERWNAAAVPGARGIIALMDSASQRQDLTDAAHRIRLPAGARLAIVAAGWPAEELEGEVRRRKPGRLTPQDRRPHLASDLVVAGESGATLVLDGLLIEGRVVIAAGDLGRLELRHCTLGAGGGGLGPGLTVQGGVEGDNTALSVLLDHTISGTLELGQAGALALCDCLLGEDQSANPDPDTMPELVAAPAADLIVRRTTVLGRVSARTLEADDSLFVGPLDIARRQAGCLRFCYLPLGSRTPRRYRCVPDLQLERAREAAGRAPTNAERAALIARLRPVFMSSRHGDSAHGVLAAVCPPAIATGAEGGGEIGAMNALGNPARLANLRDALDEYLTFGLEAGPIFVT